MVDEALIKPANIQEQLLGKINKMRQRNLTEEQKYELRQLSQAMTRSFKELTWKFFQISGSQVKELSDQEIEALFLIVHNRAAKSWLYFANSEKNLIVNSTRKLRSMLGNNFNPVRILRDGLY